MPTDFSSKPTHGRSWGLPFKTRMNLSLKLRRNLLFQRVLNGNPLDSDW